MAVAYASSGLIASAAAQTVAPAYPASIATGDGLVLVRTAKPDTAALTTPSGWTLVNTQSGGVGVFGNDTGPLIVATYFKTATGTETGTLTCDSTPATVDVQQSIIVRYTKGSGAWDVAGTGGVDTTASTDWSVAAGSDPGITSGDVVQVALCYPTDSARTWSSETLTATGATISALTVPIASTTTSLGADMTTRLHNFACSAGTASVAPVYAGTVNSAINVAGPTSMIRLREVTSGVDGTLAAGLPSVGAALAGAVTAAGTITATLPSSVVTLSSGGRTVARPNTGIVVRPDTGIVPRP
ncbi:hypothetical protein ABGB07_02315 [Micromonosporaceae bacterium B7E4]